MEESDKSQGAERPGLLVHIYIELNRISELTSVAEKMWNHKLKARPVSSCVGPQPRASESSGSVQQALPSVRLSNSSLFPKDLVSVSKPISGYPQFYLKPNCI